MMECEICGKEHAELHHCIFKSQSKIMQTMLVNFKYLCSEHHRGQESPHRNKKIDLAYKLEIQNKIKKILCKPYYTLEGLEKALKLKKNQSRYITKNVSWTSQGYETEEVIRFLMGGKIYD